MDINKLLEKQMHRYLPDECLDDERIMRFINTVNNSYNAFEKDQALSAHAFRISEQEYAEINDRLKEEIAIKKIGIKNLKEAIKAINDKDEHPVSINAEEDNLIDTLAFLKEQILRRKNMEAELNEYEHKFKMAFEKLGDNVWQHDFQTGRTYFSNTEGHFLGSLFKDFDNNPDMWWDNIVEEDRWMVKTTDEQYLRGEIYHHSLEYRMTHKDGSIRWVLDRGVVIEKDAAGLPMKVMGTHTDITKQKCLEIDLILARKQAEESSRAKEMFLANMSHEIRTPMNGILGMSRQLRKTNLDNKQRMYLDTINSAGEHLLVVINDILDISKIEAGELMLEKIGFRLKDAVERAASVMRQRVEEKGLELFFSVSGGIYSILMGDPYRLNQVLLNLLSNAIKFTEKGSVSIDCRVAEEQERGQLICIRVRDTGVGMDEEYLVHLYQKFSQEDRSVARQYGGTGLGMSICKQLVELMEGRISVKSRKGEGTEVTLYIPFCQGSEDDLPQKGKTTVDSSSLKGRKILLVEDNEMNRLVATTVLGSYGMLVYEAINGAEAIAMLRDGRYDLVLMDEQMPVMDGLESTRIIRRNIDRKIPIIALTANAIKGENERCKAAGMNDYISKPFVEGDLIRMIATYLGEGGGGVGIDETRVRDDTGRSQVPLYSLRQLWTIGHGSEAFVQKMLRLFLDQMPTATREIREAYARGDFAAVKSTAHRIKPILDNLEIVGQTEGVREIEKLAAMNCPSPLLEERILRLETVVDKVVNALKADIGS